MPDEKRIGDDMVRELW